MAERPERPPPARSFDPERTLATLDQRGVRYVLIGGLAGTRVVVTALEDVIRSNEAADREKDRVTLPTLRALLDRTRNEG